MVATTRRVRDEEDSGGELGEATTGQGSVGSAASVNRESVTAVRDGPAADTAGDAQLRPALKRGAKYQRVGEAAGGCSADDTADSGLYAVAAMMQLCCDHSLCSGCTLVLSVSILV